MAMTNPASVFYFRFIQSIICNKALLTLALLTTITISLSAQCANIELVDLRGVLAYPQIDDLTVCGDADTLSLILFTGDAGTVKGFELELGLPVGFEYAGWEYTDFGGTSISNSDPSESCPEFIVDGWDGDSLIVVNIGIRTNCLVDILSGPQHIDYSYSYTFIDTLNQVHSCSDVLTFDREYNSAVHRPVMNILSITPTNMVVSSLEEEYCHELIISQDGLSTYLRNFNLDICNVDQNSNLTITSVTTNGSNLVQDSVYNSGALTLRYVVEDDHFLGNALPGPDDDKFDTNEILTIDVCYTAANCPVGNEFPVQYKTSYGCDENICQLTDRVGSIKINPVGSLAPLGTADLDTDGITICGETGDISVTVANPNVDDTQQNVYTDLNIGFQNCVTSNLGVAMVTVNGVVLPTSAYTWNGDDINIQFLTNTNPALGLVDFDGDSFMDDLPAGGSINAVISLEVVCGIDPSDCEAIQCEDIQFYISGKTNCGNTFTEYPVPDGFNLYCGPENVYNVGEENLNAAGTIIGYDFGTYSNNGGPLAGTNEGEQEFIFCYETRKENINDCPSGADHRLEVSYTGAERFVYDIEFKPGSSMLSTDGGATYSPALDGTVTHISNSEALLVIPDGDGADDVCYKYTMVMDTCLCSAPGFFTAKQTVVSSCDDCVGGCDILRACREILLRGDPHCTPCDGCWLAEYNIESQERCNFGYTDKTMTTKHTRESLIAAGGAIDLGRFMQGDSLEFETNLIIKHEDGFKDLVSWNFSWQWWNFSANTWVANDELELIMDADQTDLVEFSFSKVGGSGVRTDIDLGALAKCQSDGVSDIGGVWMVIDDHPFSGNVDRRTISNNSGFDVWDNQSVSMSILNFDFIEAQGGNWASLTGDDCLDEMFSTYDIDVRDTIWTRLKAPLIKNPQRELAQQLGIAPPPTQFASIRQTWSAVVQDTISGRVQDSGTVLGGACGTPEPFSLTCPTGVLAKTKLILDDCGGRLEHQFWVDELPGELGDPWFTHEFKPLMHIMDVDGLIRAPLAYCAGAEVTKGGVNYAIESDSTDNMTCSSVVGYSDEVCAVASGATGDIIFNLRDQGIPPLGVGLDNCDTIKLAYDLCMVCPADIPNVTDYTLTYDWQFTEHAHTAEAASHHGDFIDFTCNTSTATTAGRSYCDEAGLSHGDIYYVDTMYHKQDKTSGVFLIMDMRDPRVPLGLVNQGPPIIAAGTPGVSVEYQEMEICNNDPDDAATGVVASVTVPYSVNLAGVFLNPDGTGALTHTLIADDGVTRTYSVTLSSSMLAVGECTTVYVGTTLLFCPAPGEFPPEICFGVSSGCAPDEIKAALTGTGGCSGSEQCYVYIFGEVGLQTEWFGTPSSFKLCEEFYLNVLVKNVKEILLLDLNPTFTIPAGMSFVPGTWEVAYPGGPTTFGPWTPIPIDPDVISGSTFSYSDDSIWSTFIHNNGLEGVSLANATEDNNKVSFRFKVVTSCDAFLSGSNSTTETLSSDPCSPGDLSSGIAETPPLIVEGAHPADFASIVLFADPEVINCEGTINEFGITGLNATDKSTADSVITCITFPPELMYISGSLNISNPSSWNPSFINEIPQTDGSMEVCFHSPPLGPYSFFGMTFEAPMDKDAPCGDIELGVDIKSVVEAVECDPGPPDACDVFVQNSLNPTIKIELAPPFIAEDLNVYTDCGAADGMQRLYWEYTINHNGPDATNQPYTINFYRDINGDKLLDAAIDELLGSSSSTFSVNDTETLMLDGFIDVDASKSCPVLFEVKYDTDCVCDHTVQCFEEIEFRGLAEFDEPLSMCPGDCLDIEVCDYISFDANLVKGATDVEYVVGAETWRTQAGMVTYASMTDNSITPPSGNYLFLREPITASFPCPVNVETIILGGGQYERASDGTFANLLNTGTPTLEYSLDNVNWISITDPISITAGALSPITLSTPVVGRFFRYVTTGWTSTSEFRFEGAPIPFEGMPPVTQDGNIVSICVPADLPPDEVMLVDFTTGTGACTVTETLEIYNIGDLEVSAGDDLTLCEGECIDLEATLPIDPSSGFTVSWTPTIGLSDPTVLEPETCVTETTTYSVEITFPGGCVKTDEVTVNVIPVPPASGLSDFEICDGEPIILVGTSGYDFYEWFEQLGGNDIQIGSTIVDTFPVPNTGIFTVKAFNDSSPCPLNIEILNVVFVECCEAMAGEIFYDLDEDGCQDLGEGLVMEPINVSLYECGNVPGIDQPAAITQTLDGEYEFGPESDNPGADYCLDMDIEYFVVFDIPTAAGEPLEDYTFSEGTADPACEASGESDDVDGITGMSECHDPTDDDPEDGDDDQNVDAGITPPCYELAGEIFYDIDNDGCHDSNETLVLEDIDVDLYECGDVPGTDQPVATTTVSDGQYEFGEESDDPGADICLMPGVEYFVVFDIPNATGEVLEDYEFSTGEANGACAVSGESDNVDPTTGASTCYDPNNDDPSDGDGDQNIDAGITPPCETLGGEIFYDTNGNGCEDGSESLVMEPIGVMLFECGDVPGVDPPAASTNVSDGEYEFGPDSEDPGAEICLEPGTEYFIVFDIPMGSGEVLDGYEFTDGIASTTCEGAGEADDVNPETGQSQCFDPNDDDSEDGDDDNSIDAGIVPPCESLGGEIFYDYDDDGCQDDDEMLVMMDVNVTLYECGDTPGVDPPAAATTVSDGEYTFGEGTDDPGADICLEAGTEYFVVFDIPNAISEELEDYEFSSGTADPACAFSGESDDVDPSTGMSGCYDPDDDDGDGDDNIDAGITPPCESLGGEIFYDDDMDGCEDGDETLVTEVIGVMLYECGDTPGVDPPVASTFTNDGMYEFGEDSDDPGADVCLMPGTQYFVVFDIPNGAGETLEDHMITMGMADAGCEALGESSDADPTTGQTECFDPNDNDSDDGDGDENMDVGIAPPCESISGEIFYDDNRDGCEDDDESLVNDIDIEVSIYECGDTPGVDQPAASTTVSDGMYEFGPDSEDPGAEICLEPGTDYFVVFDIPNAEGEALEDYSFTEGEASSECEAAGESDDVDPATGSSECVDPDDGDGDGDDNVDAGITPPCESLSGEIFYDGDDDGCQDANEMLVDQSIDVTLYECGDVPGVDPPTASTTVSDGMYEFGEDSDDPGADICLEADTEYFVVFDIPNAIGEALEEYEFSSGMADPACEAAGDSDDVDPDTGASDCQSPGDEDGDDDDNIDAGITPPCEQISGEIFYDLDENGCQDMGESLVMEDIVVSLYECGDNPAVDFPAASTTVDDGMYAFGETSDDPGADICLEAGTEYFVVFDIPNDAGEALEDFEFTSAPLNPTCAAAGQSDDVDPATGTSGCVDPNNDDGDDGDSDENVDAGIVPPCEEISGEIFIDENNNGCEDPGESLAMTNITVALYECGDIPGVDIPTAITMVTDGMYEFGEDSDDPGADICLAPNVEYFVHFDIPNGEDEALEDFSFSEEEADPACEAIGESDDVDPTTGSSECLDPSGDDDDDDVDAGIVPPCETLSGEIFVDENRDGCEDPGESLAMFDIEVSLYECGDVPGVDQPIASTTVSDGEYEFGEDSDDPGADVCLEAGTEYFVAFDLPNGPGEEAEDYEFTDGVASGDCALEGESDNVDPDTGTSGCFDPDDDDDGDGDDDENIDAGITPPCESLGGEIFYDDNGNGCQDGGESLVMESINIMLYECGDVPGVDPPAASTNVADGMYEFGEDSDDPGADVCLEAGTEYFVVFDIPMGANEVLDGFDFTSGMASTTCMGAGQSDDVDPTNGQSGCYDPNDDDGGDGDSDDNIDAGITAPCETMAGEIFFDSNGNGCQDEGESLVMDPIEVSLYECGDIPGVDQPAASTTVTDGSYEFGIDSPDDGAEICLEAGTEYFVAFDIPNDVGESLEGFDFTAGEASGECEAAGEADNVDPTTGQSGCHDPDDDDDGDGDDDENIDAGIEPPCETLGGEIFYDNNENGCQDGNESLVMESIGVTLYECGDIPGTDPPVASTSVSDGMYEFGLASNDPDADVCLESGTEYFVVFDIPMGTGEVLDGYEFTSGTASATCENAGESNDVDPDSGQSDCHNPNNNDDGDGDDDNHIDAGITPPCEQIAGEIFFDSNGNGCEDDGESLVMDPIEVSLYECGDVPGIDQPAASTTVTDGSYEFGVNSPDDGAEICLEAGTEYFVVFDIPNDVGESLEGFEFTDGEASGECEAAGEADNVDPSTGQSGCHDPDNDDAGDGDDDENIDAGIQAPCESLGGEIFYDNNENGCHDGSESLVMEALSVTLYECGDIPGTDPPVASTSVSDGMYEFGLDSDDDGADVCLESGTDYFVVFDIPMGSGEVLDGYEFTSGTASATCENAGESNDVDPDSGQSDCHDPNNNDDGDGDDDNHIDAGITPPCEQIAGEIFFDSNGNGCEDEGESLVMDPIEVSLYECGDVPGIDQPAASTTVTDGNYEFGVNSPDDGAGICLEPGTEYFVVFDIPNDVGESLEGFEFTDGEASGECEAAGEADNVDPTTGQSGCHDPDNDDDGDGDDDENIDAGIQAPCESLGGEIFYDNNENGCQDGNETLVMEPLSVTLYECGDIPGTDPPVASTSVSDGMYEFGLASDDDGADVCLESGTEYFVVFDIPMGSGEVLDGYEFSSGTASPTCESAGESTDVNPDTAQSECHDPNNNDDGDGGDDNHIDAGITPPCEQMAGEIFYDTNGNGCEDESESLVMEAIDVQLYECGDVPGLDQPFASTTVTDGMYEFGVNSDDEGANVCLEPGTEYFVLFDIPNGVGEALEGYAFTEEVATDECAISGESDNVDPATGQSSCHDPDNDDDDDGDDDENIDAGIQPPCESMAGEIFYDGNENGCQDGNENLVMEIISVTLYECGATPGVDPPVASTSVTDGMYMFGVGSDDPGADVCLEAGTEYFVSFDIPMGPGEVLDGYEFTESTASDACEAAGQSDDVDPTTGQSECHDPDNDDGGDGDADENIDAGIKPPCEQIAGEIFYDDNNNGCQDPNEPLVTGHEIEVVLYQCGDTPGLDQPAAFTSVTDGQYVFGIDSDDPGAQICLEEGDDYFVMFHVPNGQGETLEDYYFSEEIASPSCLFSGEADNIDPSTGMSGCHDPSNDDDGDGDADENIDAGLMHPCEILAGEIFYDNDNDGCHDKEEDLVTDAVNVSVYDCGATPGVDVPIASTTTTDGTYMFGDEYSLDSDDDPCLNPRLEYFVVFDFDDAVGDPLEDHYFSDGEDASCQGGPDADDVDSDTGESACYNPDNDDDDGDIDAGITPCEEIGGLVFYDWNEDGCQDDDTEGPVEGVDVYVFDCGETDTSPANALASTSTNEDGEYTFGPEEEGTAEVCLHPDNDYFVVFDVPNADGEEHEDFFLTDGDSETCSGEPASDDVDPETGASDCYDPDDDDNDTDINAGITPCEEISGEVFYDNNADGCQDEATEGPVEGVDVYVFECGETDTSPANALASATTDEDGEYAFGPEEEGTSHICLNPEIDYFVVFDVPNASGESLDDFSLTEGDGASCAGGDNANDADHTTGASACYDPDGDDDDSSIDAGIMPCEEIAGEVFYDWDDNGCQSGAAETGVEGVTVFIFACGETDLSPDNALASDTTDVNGQYVFGPGEEDDADVCLQAGSEYFVLFDLPNDAGEMLEGFDFTEGDGETCDGTGDGDDIDPATGQSECHDPEDDDSGDGDDDQNVDAGINGCLDLAGTVFFDVDGNGCQDDSSEPGAEGVTVYIYECGESNPTPENSLGSEVTNSDGDYEFGPDQEGDAQVCLQPGNEYFVVFDVPNAPQEQLDDYDLTQGTGSDCDIDESADDANHITGQSECYDPMDNDEDDRGGDMDVDAGLIVPIVDLAIDKTTTQTEPVVVGDIVTFNLEVCNVGTLPVNTFDLTDNVPAGFVLSPDDANGWMYDPDQMVATTTGSGLLEPGMCTDVEIDLLVIANAGPEDFMNIAVVSNEDDTNPDNDTSSQSVGIFDLALQKTAPDRGPFDVGALVEFNIEICNQGSVDASEFEITDYIPTGLTFDSSLPQNSGWVGSDPVATFDWTGLLESGECTTISIYLEVIALDPFGLINMSEISESEFNDYDSTADGDNTNDVGNDPFSSLNDITDNTNGDEDDHDQEWLVVCSEVTCKGQINMSLDGDCESNFVPSMMINPAWFPIEFYDIVITDEHGQEVENQFDASDIGNTFSVSISIPFCDNISCWGNMTVEDKFAPVLDCQTDTIRIPCHAISQFEPPSATENCSEYEVILVDEKIESFDCDPDYTGLIERTYIARDGAGNESVIPCKQVFLLERIDLTDVMCPEETILQCNTFPLDDNGHPLPFDPVSGSGSGTPYFPIPDGDINSPSVGSEIALLPGAQELICGTFVDYEDQVVQSNECSTKIIRYWTVREWWCSGENVTGCPQIIEITDTIPPVIKCPKDLTVTVNTGYNSCDARVNLPGIKGVDGCEGSLDVQVEYEYGLLEGNGGFVLLPIGDNIVTYHAFDNCNNRSSCTVKVTVIDETDPVAICDQNTVVSIPTDGNVEVWAETFDDGSFDECDLKSYEVRRMNSPCDEDDTNFGESVSFCCDDLGEEVMVALRVCDSSGNCNICMVAVNVQDKTPAELVCPPDMTIVCTDPYDVNNLDEFFGSVNSEDNCFDKDLITETVDVNINQCGVGTISRTFSLDDEGDANSCTQLITVELTNPFTEDDIVWPSDTQLEGCPNLDTANPDNLPTENAFPTVVEGVCDLVGFNFDDEVFEFVAGSEACLKIIRKWQVLNWCQRDDNGDFEIYEHFQEIKINNTVAPIIGASCENVIEYESIDIDCGDVPVFEVLEVTDDCTEVGNLDIEWVIDVDNDGDPSNDLRGTGSIDVDVPVGNHTIQWTVRDLCGNVSICEQTLKIINNKSPNAICINGLSVELVGMDTDNDGILDTEMAVLWASDFDAGSNHACGYEVIVSFSQDPEDQFMSFECVTGRAEIELWVTDINGNTSVCETFVEVQNNVNEELCRQIGNIGPEGSGGDGARVAGQIYTESNVNLPETEVHLMGSNLMEMTDEDGAYLFSDMPIGGSYDVRPFKDTDHLNGVSTLDIILIQQHILGLESLSSPYQYIAADANSSNSVTSVDLIDIRKLVLGIVDEYPNNTSWRFVDASYQYADDDNPLNSPIPENYNIFELEEDMNIDFIGVKIGDVNGSVVANLTGEEIEERSNEKLKLQSSLGFTEKGIPCIEISVEENTSLRGFQFTINEGSNELIAIESNYIDWSDQNYSINGSGMISVSWHSNEVIEFEKDQVLFQLIGHKYNYKIEELEVSSDITRKEAYNDSYEILDVELQTTEINDQIVLNQNEPNPWLGKTMISYELPEAKMATFIFRDANGNLLRKMQVESKAGLNMLEIERDMLPSVGVVYYEIQVGQERRLRKMISLQ